jgi:hypothetical protein
MEAAKLAVQRMRDEADPPVPDDLNFTGEELALFGEIGYKWRNYLAVGSLGPDLFFMLPDFKSPLGNVLLLIVKWVLETWEQLDKAFVGPWEDLMGPVGANDQDLSSQLTGGLSNQLAQVMDSVHAAEFNVLLDLMSRLSDWFGKLTSGVPQGFGDSGFYWSDMFHYRHTYEFPRALWRKALDARTQAQGDLEGVANPSDAQLAALADAETLVAFAMGWTTHCATDVTGHPFTNAKSGGPFRLHWQRHHLVENHMDAAAYDVSHGGDTLYEELGKSGLHFRVAFRTRDDDHYNGRHDAPAYDYFTDFPAYPTADTAIADEERGRHFDMDPGELPEHLREFLKETMREVYGNDPKVLMDAPAFAEPNSGIPNDQALNEMWNIVFRYLRKISSDGFIPREPTAPPIVNDHPFPTPPPHNGALPPQDDGRGGDPGDDTNPRGESFNIFDCLVSIYSWLKYIGQVAEWLLTVVPGLILDVTTFPARAVLYYTVASPMYSLYMATRKLLVLEGFLTPKPEEIDLGLTTLGVASRHHRAQLIADLNDSAGMAPVEQDFDEPSGRAKPDAEFSADSAYPRQAMRDPVDQVNQSLQPFTFRLPLPEDESYDDDVNSHWVLPWKYPEEDLAGDRIGWEPHRTHVGPWNQGDEAQTLLDSAATDVDAARRFEEATTPDETSDVCSAMLPQGRHLGNPVDYSLYLISRLSRADDDTPDFNLDADRGYAFHCWDFDRHAPGPQTRDANDFHVYFTVKDGTPTGRFLPKLDFEQPCTVPEQFTPDQAANDTGNPRRAANRYKRNVPLHIHYLDPGAIPGCCQDLASVTDLAEVSDAEVRQAGMRPDGSEV